SALRCCADAAPPAPGGERDPPRHRARRGRGARRDPRAPRRGDAPHRGLQHRQARRGLRGGHRAPQHDGAPLPPLPRRARVRARPLRRRRAREGRAPLQRGPMTAPIRALIVDDEPLARASIRALLAADPEVVVVGDCIGADAPALIERSPVDLLFLDVQMPEVDGFQVLSALAPAPLPATIFVTAHDAYAVRAFEVHAIDYLLKPFDDARFFKALARAKHL